MERFTEGTAVYIQHASDQFVGISRDVAVQLLKLPKGHRVLLMIGFEDDLVFVNNGKYKSGYRLMSHPLDRTKDVSGKFTGYPSPWLENGTADLKAKVQRWIADFVAAEEI